MNNVTLLSICVDNLFSYFLRFEIEMLRCLAVIKHFLSVLCPRICLPKTGTINKLSDFDVTLQSQIVSQAVVG